jgi:DNA-binding GntR family transcriptional regulator
MTRKGKTAAEPAASREEKQGGESKFSLGEFVRTKVREAIESGQYQPGSRVRENDVAEWLKVSRTPVREALRHLEAEGLLVFVPWRGVIVAELDRRQVAELYKVRAALEGLAASLAARHISDTELSLLRDLLARGDRAKDAKTLAELNKQFHETIYLASHNRYLVQNLNSLRGSLALLKGTTYSFSGRPEQAQAEHRAIFEAIGKRDPVAAEATARQHLVGAELARLTMMADPAHR